ALEDLASLGIDAAEITLVGLQGGVPELAVHPGDARNESIRFNRAKDGTGRGVDLVDLAGVVLSNPEGPFGPSQARVASVSGRQDSVYDVARARIDLLDRVAGELPQVFAVEGGAGLGGDSELADQRSAHGIEGHEAFAAGAPDARGVDTRR